MTAALLAGAAVVVYLFLTRQGPHDPKTGVTVENTRDDVMTRLDDYRYTGGAAHFFESETSAAVSGAAAGFAVASIPGAIVGAIAGAVLGSVLHFIAEPPDDFGAVVRGVMRDEMKVKAPSVPRTNAAIDALGFYMVAAGLSGRIWANRRTGQLALRVVSRDANAIRLMEEGPADGKDAVLTLAHSYLAPVLDRRHTGKYAAANGTVLHSTIYKMGGMDKAWATFSKLPLGAGLPLVVAKGAGRGKRLGDTFWTEDHTLLVDVAHTTNGRDWIVLNREDQSLMETVVRYWEEHAK